MIEFNQRYDVREQIQMLLFMTGCEDDTKHADVTALENLFSALTLTPEFRAILKYLRE